MAKEFVWGCELNAKKKTVKWDMLDFPANTEDAINFNLLIKSAILGSSVPMGQENVIELDTVCLMGNQIRQPLVRLTRGTFEQRSLDILISHPGSKFRLVEGDGPVYIWGQHMLEFASDLSQENGFSTQSVGVDYGDEELEDEEVEEEYDEDDEDYVDIEEAEEDEASDPESSDTDIKPEELTMLEVESCLPLRDVIKANISDGKKKKRGNVDVEERPSKIAKLDDSADESGDPGKPASRQPKASEELEKNGSGNETSSKEEAHQTATTTHKKKSKGRSKTAR